MPSTPLGAEEPSERVATEREYTADPHRPRRRSATRIRPSTRLRHIYFAFAAVWGFLIGVGTIVAALAWAGDPVYFGGGVAVLLLPGLALAIVGGIVSAGAYREARRRLR